MAKAFREGTASVDDLMRAAIQFERASSATAKQVPPLALPAIVCGAFALELLLKTLIVMEGKKFPFTHKVEVLYGRLSPAGQKTVSDAWGVVVADPHWSTIKAVMSEAGDTVSDSLTDNLRLSSNAFEDFRYMRAGQSSAYYMGGLTTTLLDAMLRDHPEFKALIPRMAEESA